MTEFYALKLITELKLISWILTCLTVSVVIIGSFIVLALS